MDAMTVPRYAGAVRGGSYRSLGVSTVAGDAIVGAGAVRGGSSRSLGAATVPGDADGGADPVRGGSWRSIVIITMPRGAVAGSDALRVLRPASLAALPASVDETIWEWGDAALVSATDWPGAPCNTHFDWPDGVSHATGALDMVTDGCDWPRARWRSKAPGRRTSAGTRCVAESW